MAFMVRRHSCPGTRSAPLSAAAAAANKLCQQVCPTCADFALALQMLQTAHVADVPSLLPASRRSAASSCSSSNPSVMTRASSTPTLPSRLAQETLTTTASLDTKPKKTLDAASSYTSATTRPLTPMWMPISPMPRSSMLATRSWSTVLTDICSLALRSIS